MTPPRTDLLQGTLDVLILKTLFAEPMHGWGISQRIQQLSEDVLQVNQGSLYPALYRLESLEREMDEEMRFHIEMETRKNLGRGMTPEQASTEALRGFGGLDRHKEEGRDASGIPWLESFSQDTRIALRGLKRNPAYALASIATLALGIGANVAVFSVVHAVFLQELPYGSGD